MGCASFRGEWCDEWGWVLHFYGGDVGDEVVLGIFCTLCGLLLFLRIQVALKMRNLSRFNALNGLFLFLRYLSQTH